MLDPTPGPLDLATFEELLARSETKLELLEGEVVAFAGGSIAHAVLTSRLHAAVAGVAATGCQAFTSDVAVRLQDARTYVFPDVSYTCEPLDPQATAIVAPVLVIEVISPDSKTRDRVEKLDAYQSIPSLQEYVLVDSRRVWTCVYRRFASTWTETVLNSLEDTLELHAPSVAIPLATLYAGTARILEEP
ncbi:MAG TPA: Uma2 family endonuclease [Candidatus Sulfotelmatobacter sp.]|nr:Uma2 family endonuclease [Candidatus Sulfotelmatobacter sp.]